MKIEAFLLTDISFYDCSFLLLRFSLTISYVQNSSTVTFFSILSFLNIFGEQKYNQHGPLNRIRTRFEIVKKSVVSCIIIVRQQCSEKIFKLPRT